jgi:hypothetical protein
MESAYLGGVSDGDGKLSKLDRAWQRFSNELPLFYLYGAG